MKFVEQVNVRIVIVCILPVVPFEGPCGVSIYLSVSFVLVASILTQLNYVSCINYVCTTSKYPLFYRTLVHEIYLLDKHSLQDSTTESKLE
jgi:hypothetical protein